VKYEAVIFDLSDTLIEYTPNYARIYGDRVGRLGYKVSDEIAKEISRAVNMAIGEQSRRGQIGVKQVTQEQLTVLMDRAALSCVTNNILDAELSILSRIPVPQQEISLIHGVIEVLDELRRKFRLAIVSNHYTWIMNYLRESGLSNYFETIIISEIVGVEKPDPHILQIALQELDLQPEQCLYVGDQPNDVLCAKLAGVDCVWVAPKELLLPKSIPYQADYRITSVVELIDLL
jgi:putative hydrolase of the HAD superfamily